MIVRWLGAFAGKNRALSDALLFEVCRDDEEAAAEPLQNGKSYVPSKVGLVIKNENVIRRFNCDVFSVQDCENPERLSPTRRLATSNHKECFVRMTHGCIVGVAVKGLSTLTASERRIVLRFAKFQQIPIIEIKP